MKKIGITFVCCCIILVVGCFVGCVTPKSEYLRIHIRANSNAYYDQEIKYEVRDLVVNYLTPLVSNCTSKVQVLNVIENEKSSVKALIDQLLTKNGYNYRAKISVRNENFPSRVYEGLTLQAGYYDALIIELGDGVGDNWWCVVYPPLCFSGKEDINYRSKIFDLINGL